MDSPLKSKSYDFAIEIVKLANKLQKDNKEFVLSRQILKSGTAIGALIREAQFGRSRADFSNKLSIALKEANETYYWLSLLKDTAYVSRPKFEELIFQCDELIAMLVSSVKTTR